MASQELECGCLTCNWEVGADSLTVQNDGNSLIPDVLRKHFWFTEMDFQGAMVCRTCWGQVYQFHQFYMSVEKLYHDRMASVIIKSEPAVIENDCLEMTEEMNQKQEFTAEVKEEPSLEIFDGNDSNNVQSSDEEKDDNRNDPDEVQQFIPHQGYIPREQRLRQQAELEDNYIRGHFRYICRHCGAKSLNFAMQLKHCLEEHDVNFVECCGKKFFKRGRLYQHVQVLNNPDSFRCAQCGKRFGNNSALLTHMKEMHESADARKFKCERCARTFVLPSSYKRHLKVHRSQEQRMRYPCTDCPKTFSSSRLQKDHFAAAHEGISQYKCPFCGKAFYCSANMHKHKKLMHPTELLKEQKLR